jgi:hypothetical protein
MFHRRLGQLCIGCSLWLTACPGSTTSPSSSVSDTHTSTSTTEDSRTPKSLVIALDGARADALRYAATPHLDSLADGSWSNGYRGASTHAALTVPDGDTVSGPNHVSIMTGGTVTQTGVTSNDANEMAAGNYTAFPHYLSRLETAEPHLNTAYLYTWATDGFIRCDADFTMVDDEDTNTDRVVEMLAGTFDSSGDPGAWSEGQDPDAVFVFYDFIDGAGHSDGFSLQVASYVSALERADSLTGVLLDAIRDRPQFDDEHWQIIVTADHGGYETGHGGRGGHRETIPFIVSSTDVESGALPDGTRNLDVAPTVLDHFGMGVPADLTGAPRGRGAAPEPDIDLQQGLIANYGFDGDLSDSAGGGHHAVDGPSASVETTGGKFDGHLSLSGTPAYVTLPEVDDLTFTAEDPFTVALWMRADNILDGDPVLIGNKDWVSGMNPGWALLANEGGNNSAGSNYGTGSDRISTTHVPSRSCTTVLCPRHDVELWLQCPPAATQTRALSGFAVTRAESIAL